MKKYAVSAVVFLMGLVILGAYVAGILQVRKNLTEHHYRYIKAVVESVDNNSSSVVFMDEDGLLWSAYTNDTPGFVPGDKYVLTFDNMGTADITDDEIVDIF